MLLSKYISRENLTDFVRLPNLHLPVGYDRSTRLVIVLSIKNLKGTTEYSHCSADHLVAKLVESGFYFIFWVIILVQLRLGKIDIDNRDSNGGLKICARKCKKYEPGVTDPSCCYYIMENPMFLLRNISFRK